MYMCVKYRHQELFRILFLPILLLLIDREFAVENLKTILEKFTDER